MIASSKRKCTFRPTEGILPGVHTGMFLFAPMIRMLLRSDVNAVSYHPTGSAIANSAEQLGEPNEHGGGHDGRYVHHRLGSASYILLARTDRESV